MAACARTEAPRAQAPSPPRDTLTLATWNLEWLIAPTVFAQLKDTCARPEDSVTANDRRLPCDVAQRFERSSRDFKALAGYAKALNADVIALQEVDGPEAARLVFEGYAFCFSRSRHLQNTGFAVRADLPMRCGRDVVDLSLKDTVRRGTELILFPGTPREIRLLSVHLKSGCSRDPLDSARQACATLARQVAPLEAWIDAQARAGRPFAVLGDFNRDLVREARDREAGKPAGLWGEIDDGDPPEADLVNTAEGQPFTNCVRGQSYRAYIDYIVLSRTLAGAWVPGSFRRVTYAPKDARRLRLSDHCPVAIQVRVGQLARVQ
jgi:endonuclease/exonuclease/phosphatase family metal-dependent hydrolase